MATENTDHQLKQSLLQQGRSKSAMTNEIKPSTRSADFGIATFGYSRHQSSVNAHIALHVGVSQR